MAAISFIRRARAPRRLPALLVAASCALLAGCATQEQVADAIVDANVAQEMAANRLMLLNIVRAKHRHPMHFVRIGAIRMPPGLGNGTFTLPIPFGPDRSQAYSLGTQFGQSYGIDSAVQDSQEFMQGVTAPVTPSLLGYYLDQGWPQSLVLHIFVKSIEVFRQDPGKDPVRVSRVENYPLNPKAFRAFRETVESLEPCRFMFSAKPSVSPYGPKLPAGQFSDLKALAELGKAGIAFTPVDSAGKVTDTLTASEYRLARVDKDLHFALAHKGQQKCEGVRIPEDEAGAPGDAGAKSGGTLVPMKSVQLMSGVVEQDHGPKLAESRPASSAAVGTVTYHASLSLRSPEAMLYYLGEIVRRQFLPAGEGGGEVYLGPNGWDMAGASTANRVLFRLQSPAPPQAPFAVTYLGRTYALGEGSEVDRSTQALWLVAQVLALQNKGTVAPATTNVRVVN